MEKHQMQGHPDLVSDVSQNEHENNLDDSEAKIPKHFEDVIEGLGSFGHWQRVIFVLLCSSDLWGACAMLVFVFTGAVPKWRCVAYKEAISGNVFPSQNLTWLNETETYKSCSVNESEYTCVNFEFFDEFTSIVSKWNLVCDRSYVTDLVISIQSVGTMVGAAIFGHISDWVGRKLSYYIAVFLILIAGFASSFAPLWQVYASCRFVVGFGFGSYMVVNSVYPLEFVGQRWRTLCGTLGFWAVGGMLLSLSAYFIRDWSLLTIATSASGILFFGTWWIVPESPRWLMQKNRYEEAEKILEKIAEKNNKPVPSLKFLKKFAAKEREEEREIQKYSYIDLFKKAEYRKRIIIFMVIWFTTFVVYYEISYNLRHLSGNRYINMLLGAFVDGAGMIITIAFNNLIGRRFTTVLAAVSMLISNVGMLSVYAADKAEEIPDAILFFALFGKATSLTGTYVVAIFTAELFPTVIRNLSVGAGQTAARIGAIIAPQLVLLGTYHTLSPYIIGIILSALIIPLSLLLPETKGKPLQDKYGEDAKENDAGTVLLEQTT